MQLYAIYIISRLLPPPSPQSPLGFLMAPDPWVELSLNQPHCLILCLGVAFSEISLDVSSCPTCQIQMKKQAQPLTRSPPGQGKAWTGAHNSPRSRPGHPGFLAQAHSAC